MFTAHAACGFIVILARPPPQSSVHRKGEGADPPYYGEAPLPFCLAHRASAALRAISCRRSGEIRTLRTFAEAIPPFRPKATA